MLLLYLFYPIHMYLSRYFLYFCIYTSYKKYVIVSI
nr:MAG TPA: TraX protein [Caudoviricetes sp.]